MSETDIRVTRSNITREEGSGSKPVLDDGAIDSSRKSGRPDGAYFTTRRVLSTGKDLGLPVPLPQVTHFETGHSGGTDDQADAGPVRPGKNTGKATRSPSATSGGSSSLSSMREAYKLPDFLKLSGITKLQGSDHVTG